MTYATATHPDLDEPGDRTTEPRVDCAICVTEPAETGSPWCYECTPKRARMDGRTGAYVATAAIPHPCGGCGCPTAGTGLCDDCKGDCVAGYEAAAIARAGR